MYEIEKLSNKYDDLSKSTRGNIKAQKELNAMK